MARVKEYILAGLEIVLGFRKFIVMGSLVVSGVYFLHRGTINGREFVDLLSTTTVSFMAANSIETLGDTVSNWLKSKL